jgi:hypothetical protein
MNFSMAVKEAIFNKAEQYPVSVVGDKLVIKGFGTFDKAKITAGLAQRYVAGVAGTLSFSAPSATSIGLATGETKIPVTVALNVYSTRHSAEWANDYIEAGSPFMIDLLLDASDNAAAVATKLKAALAAYNSTWPNSPLPFTVGGTNPTVLLTGTYFDLYFGAEVVFIKNHSSIGETVTGTVVMSSEPRFDGKYLEENVRMSTANTEGIYAIKPGEVPLTVGFTTIEFEAQSDKDGGVDGGWAPHANMGIIANANTGSATSKYTLYFNEEACLETGGPVATIVNFLAVTAGLGWTTMYKDGSLTPATDLADFLA